MPDRAQDLTAFVRLSRDGEVLFEGDLKPSQSVAFPDGLLLELIWIRVHHEPKAK